MTTYADAVSDKAVDCFIHGLAHLIDELGLDRGLAAAADLLEAAASPENENSDLEASLL